MKPAIGGTQRAAPLCGSKVPFKQAPGKVRVRLSRSDSPKGGTACREASVVNQAVGNGIRRPEDAWSGTTGRQTLAVGKLRDEARHVRDPAGCTALLASPGRYHARRGPKHASGKRAGNIAKGNPDVLPPWPGTPSNAALSNFQTGPDIRSSLF